MEPEFPVYFYNSIIYRLSGESKAGNECLQKIFNSYQISNDYRNF